MIHNMEGQAGPFLKLHKSPLAHCVLRWLSCICHGTMSCWNSSQIKLENESQTMRKESGYYLSNGFLFAGREWYSWKNVNHNKLTQALICLLFKLRASTQRNNRAQERCKAGTLHLLEPMDGTFTPSFFFFWASQSKLPTVFFPFSCLWSCFFFKAVNTQSSWSALLSCPGTSVLVAGPRHCWPLKLPAVI